VNKVHTMNPFLISATAFAMFVVCPRMAGMMNVIANSTDTKMFKLVVLGTMLSVPFLIGMVLAFKAYGIYGALAFNVGTDMLAVLLMKNISARAGFETFVIALFVLLGVKVASAMANRIGW